MHGLREGFVMALGEIVLEWIAFMIAGGFAIAVVLGLALILSFLVGDDKGMR